MSQVYSRSVKLRGNGGVIFDKMGTFLTARGFTTMESQKPFLIVADRGMLRPTSRIEKYPHTLVLTFRPADDSLLISYVYIMSDFWHYTPGDRKFFDDEIDLLIRGLVADGAEHEEGAPSAAPDHYIRELRELAKLKDEGVITTEEFEGKKKRLLTL